MIDTKGQKIKRNSLQSALFFSFIAGGLGSVWFILCQPQQILTVLIKNHLHASDAQLGNFIALLNFAGIFHLGAIVIYSYTKTIKKTWLIICTLHRGSAFFIAGAAFYVYKGGQTHLALILVMLSSFLFSYMLGNLGGSGWWTWMSALLPEKSRASYFAKRSSLAQFLNVICFFSATWLLDYYSSKIFLVYTIIYLVAGVFGTLDILIHLVVPEPQEAHEKEPLSKKRFFEPIYNRNFFKFCLISGFAISAINIATPFQAPFLTNPQTVGAPNIWLGIMYTISQLLWVLMIPFWGMVMDRFGKKPVVLMGLLYPLGFLFYTLLTKDNYTLLLPIISIWIGLFSPAFWEGLNQMMLVLTPSKNRTAYVAWYWAIMGMVGSLGPLLGGQIMRLTGSLAITTYTSIAFIALSFIILSRIKTYNETSFQYVVSLITSPSTFKTYSMLPTLSGDIKPQKIEKALKSVKKKTGLIAFDEIASRLDDPDQEVREEATSAMGRIGSEKARDLLITHLNDENSLIRPEAAKALGKMGDNEAIPYLIDGLYTGDEELQEEAAIALGKLKSEDSVKALKQLIQEPRSQRVKVSGVQSIAKQVHYEAVIEIMDLWEQTTNMVLKTQLAISLGNLLGKPGEFYRCVTGTKEKQESTLSAFFESINNNLKRLKTLDPGYLRHITEDLLPQVEELMGEEQYDQAFKDVHAIILNLIQRRLDMMGFEDDKTKIQPFLKEKDTFLFLGNHIMTKLSYLKEEKSKKMERTEVLLGIYFIKSYSTKRYNKLQKTSPTKKGGQPFKNHSLKEK